MQNASFSNPAGTTAAASSCNPLGCLPELSFPHRLAPIPDEAACRQLWDKYGMLDNIRAHSLLVAKIATALALRAIDFGLQVDASEVRASALLHDIAKTYCIRQGGGHAQLGASCVVQETHNYAIARGVFYHVYWPWPLPVDDPVRICSLPFFVLYADKRARHDKLVTLRERFEDLLVRYGDTEQHRQGIQLSYEQGKSIEKALSAHLELTLDEDSSDSWRLV